MSALRSVVGKSDLAPMLLVSDLCRMPVWQEPALPEITVASTASHTDPTL